VIRDLTEHRDPQLRATRNEWISDHQPRLRVLVDGIKSGNSITCWTVRHDLAQAAVWITFFSVPQRCSARSSGRSADEPHRLVYRAHARAPWLGAFVGAVAPIAGLAVLASFYGGPIASCAARACRRAAGGQCTAAVSGAVKPVIASWTLRYRVQHNGPLRLNFEGEVQGNTTFDRRRATP